MFHSKKIIHLFVEENNPRDLPSQFHDLVSQGVQQVLFGDSIAAIASSRPKRVSWSKHAFRHQLSINIV